MSKREMIKLYKIARARAEQAKADDFRLTSHKSIWEGGTEPLVLNASGDAVHREAQTFTCDLCGSVMHGGSCACNSWRE